MDDERNSLAEFQPSAERLDQVQIRVSVIDGGHIGDEREWYPRMDVATNDQLRDVAGELAIKARRPIPKEK